MYWFQQCWGFGRGVNTVKQGYQPGIEGKGFELLLFSYQTPVTKNLQIFPFFKSALLSF